MVHLVSVFMRASISWSAAALTSLNFLSNLFMLLFVCPLFGNFVLDCLALHPLTDIIFLLESYFRH